MVALVPAAQVYGFRPQSTAYPCIVVDEMEFADESLQVEALGTATVTAHVWTQERTPGTAHQIVDALRAALHRQSLTVTGGAAVDVTESFRSVVRDEEGTLLHGVIRFDIIVE